MGAITSAHAIGLFVASVEEIPMNDAVVTSTLADHIFLPRDYSWLGWVVGRMRRFPCTNK